MINTIGEKLITYGDEKIDAFRKGYFAALRNVPQAYQQHTLYKTGDADAPECIKDRNGEVVLALCKSCNKAEVELSEPCQPVGGADGDLKPTYSQLDQLYNGQCELTDQLAERLEAGSDKTLLARIAELEAGLATMNHRYADLHSTVGQPVSGAMTEPELSKCPECGGEANQGHDRCIPPAPYCCSTCAAPAQQPEAPVNVLRPHPDDIAVDRFAVAMKIKMAASRTKGRYGWGDPVLCPVERLQSMMAAHMEKGDPVDVGNFAMMLFNRGAVTKAPLTIKPWVDAAIAGETTQQNEEYAELYRWLRNPERGMSSLLTVISDDCHPPHIELKCGDDLDAAIKAAIAKELK